MTASRLDPFYPIVDDCRWLERLLPLGVKLVQLRIKELAPAELRNQVNLAKTLCEQHGCQLIVNDYWQIAIELGCDYIHLGQEDLDGADLDAIRAAGIRFGVSTHSDAELERALATRPDYIALGPVYPTILKKMPWSPQGLERVTTWKQRIGDLPHWQPDGAVRFNQALDFVRRHRAGLEWPDAAAGAP